MTRRAGMSGRGLGRGRLASGGGGGAADVAPAVDATLRGVFDGSRRTGTLANTAGNGGVVTAPHNAALESADGDFSLVVDVTRYDLSRDGEYVVGQVSATEAGWTVQCMSDGTILARVGNTVSNYAWQSGKRTTTAVFSASGTEVSAPERRVIGIQFFCSDAVTNANRIRFYDISGEIASTIPSGTIPGAIYTGGSVPITIGQGTGAPDADMKPLHGEIAVRLSIGQRLTEGEWITAIGGGAFPGEVARWDGNGDWNDPVGGYHGVASGGTGFVPAAQSHASGASTRVGFLWDSIGVGRGASPANIPHGIRSVLTRALYHVFGRRIDLVGTRTENPDVGMLDIEHDSIGDREIGADHTTVTSPTSVRYELAQGLIATIGAEAMVIGGGTNDLNDGTAPTGTTTAARMNAAIDLVYGTEADSFLTLVLNLPAMTTANAAEVTVHNSALATHVSTQQGAGRNVVLVDLYAALNGDRGLADTVHHGTANQALMGYAIAVALDGALP